jgi:hypothetical protein
MCIHIALQYTAHLKLIPTQVSPTLHVTILLSIMSDDIDTKYNSVSDQLTNPQDPVYDSECEHTESADIGTTTPTHTPQAPVLPVYDHQMEPSESYSDGDLEHDPPINTDSEMSHDDALEQPEAKEHSADMSTHTSESEPYEAGATKCRKLD